VIRACSTCWQWQETGEWLGRGVGRVAGDQGWEGACCVVLLLHRLLHAAAWNAATGAVSAGKSGEIVLVALGFVCADGCNLWIDWLAGWLAG
jgi:hypothetical protein